MTNEKELENQEEIKIPWQAKVWIGFIVAGLAIFLFIIIFTFLFSESIQDREFFMFFGLVAFLLLALVIFGLM